MPDRYERRVALADAVADIMRGVAGWLLVGLGVVWLLAALVLPFRYPDTGCWCSSSVRSSHWPPPPRAST